MLNSLDDLTLGEVDAAEVKAGVPLGSLGDPSVPKGKLWAALYWVARRREDPAFTWGDALNVNTKTAMEYIGLAKTGDGVDPTQE